MVKISVSVLSKNDNNSILKLNKTNADFAHIDVMDGKFVDEVHFSFSEIENLKKQLNFKLDIHLMVTNPSVYFEQLKMLKPEFITVHYEALNGDFSILEKIKNSGIKCGLSVKPITDIRNIFYLLNKIDLVLIMSVEPGYGGQSFIPNSLEKVCLLKDEIKNQGLKTLISIDGGINSNNAKSCIEAGCDILVSGSYILGSENWQQAIDKLRQ